MWEVVTLHTGMERELLAPARVELAVEALTWAAEQMNISKYSKINQTFDCVDPTSYINTRRC